MPAVQLGKCFNPNAGKFAVKKNVAGGGLAIVPSKPPFTFPPEALLNRTSPPIKSAPPEN